MRKHAKFLTTKEVEEYCRIAFLEGVKIGRKNEVNVYWNGCDAEKPECAFENWKNKNLPNSL